MKKLSILFLFFANYCFAQFETQSIDFANVSLEKNFTVSENYEASNNEQKELENQKFDQSNCVLICSMIEPGEMQWGELQLKPAMNKSTKFTGGSISGKILDATSKEQLLFASIALYRDEKLATGTMSDLDGNYMFSGLEAGKYDIEASYVGYKPIKIVDIIIDEETSIDHEMITEMNATKMIAPAIKDANLYIPIITNTTNSIRVVDQETNEVLIGVNAVFKKESAFVYGVSSDIEGKLSTRNLKEDKYQLTLSYIGYETIDTIIDMNRNPSFQFEMKLKENLLTPIYIIDYKVPSINRCGAICTNTVTTVCEMVNVPMDSLNVHDRDIQAENLKLDLFPNPAFDYINLNVKQNTSTVFISTQLGQVVYQLDNPSPGLNEISLSDFPAGSYFVSVVNGGLVKTEKLVIAK